MKFKAFSLACSFLIFAANCQEKSIDIVETKFKTETLFTGSDIIWGMDFLPSGELIYTEKKGKIFTLKNGVATEITGFPEVHSAVQGGLSDIKLHPKYKSNGWIYASYASLPEGSKDAQSNLVRFKISKNKIKDLEPIFKTEASNGWKGHYGGRIAFDKAGMLYFSVGEGGQNSRGGINSYNQNAQNTKIAWGKIHRMTDSGKVPTDNPIVGDNTEPTTIFSYGHRNPQGLVYNPLTDQIFETEHGPKGGDELNVIQKGKNYGWPWVSFGVNYDGVKVTDNPIMEGIEAPINYWIPSIGTCGLTVVTQDKFKGWRGSLLAGGLAKEYLARLEIKDGKVTGEQKLLEKHRVRCVIEGPDGNIYVAVENPGRIIKISPE